MAITAVLGASGAVHANTITSNDPVCAGAPTARLFSVTATSVVQCVAKGVGNLNDNESAVLAFDGGGWTFLGKAQSDNGWSGSGLSIDFSNTNRAQGTFSIAGSVWSQYGEVLFGLKSGQGQLDPDWAVFELAANTTSGSWGILPAGQGGGLSHATIWVRGEGGGGGGGSVPEPAPIALMGVALAGMAAARRRRRGS